MKNAAFTAGWSLPSFLCSSRAQPMMGSCSVGSWQLSAPNQPVSFEEGKDVNLSVKIPFWFPVLTSSPASLQLELCSQHTPVLFGNHELILRCFLAVYKHRRTGRAEERAVEAPREAQHRSGLQQAGAQGEVPIPSPDKITFVPP